MKTIVLPACVALAAGIAAPLPQPTAGASAPAAAETYQVDTAHSFVTFRTQHLGISRAHGRFNQISDKSKVVYDPDDVSKSSILIVIDASSVDTANDGRDRHLKSADFLSAEENPEIVFESSKVSGKPDALEVQGDLSLHGVTKPVTAKARLIGRGEVKGRETRFMAGFEAHFTIDMREFEFDFVKKNPGAIGPEVDLTVNLECVRQ